MGTEIVDLRDLQGNISRIWKEGEKSRKASGEKDGKAETASNSGTFHGILLKNLQAFERLIAHLSYTRNPGDFMPKEIAKVPGIEECVRKIMFDMKAAGKDFVTKDGKPLEENKVRMFIISSLLKIILPAENEDWGTKGKVRTSKSMNTIQAQTNQSNHPAAETTA